jgi:integrase/recombinase XerD
MTRSTGQRRFHLKDTQPNDPAVKRLGGWPPANRNFYLCFRRWLQNGGYGESALHTYGCAARLALGWLDKPFWEIDPQEDIERVRQYIAGRYDNESTRREYGKGLKKLAEYLCVKGRRALPRKPINWQTYLGPLPEWLHGEIRAYIAHRRRGWSAEMQRRATHSCLSQLTCPLRWMAAQVPLADASEITPALWFEYLDGILEEGRSPSTVNTRLYALLGFLRFLTEQGSPVCQRMLRVRPIDNGTHLHRDVPREHIRRLLQAIDAEAASERPKARHLGIMDRAWFLLMLTSGLRCVEIRRLRPPDLDLEGRRARIVQSKGLKDRLVYLTPEAVQALRSYLEVRGTATDDHVFIFRHRPLTPSYCWARMRTYSRRCGVNVTPHNLRHSCATYLLNAGAPVLTVQAILGHRYVDTTLRYARLYDGTVAADYYRAMDEVERHLTLQEDADRPMPSVGQLLALVDSLQAGTLNEQQRETVYALRIGLLALAERIAEPPHESAGPASRTDLAADLV